MSNFLIWLCKFARSVKSIPPRLPSDYVAGEGKVVYQHKDDEDGDVQHLRNVDSSQPIGG
jgi:hypothetical protein